MNDITYAVSVDVNNPIIPYNVYIASVLDSNVRYLEITLYQNGDVIILSNTATATASLVTDNVLVDGSVNCTISDNIISVPLEGLQRHGNLDVQVTVTEGEKVLAIPFPIQVRVTPNIAENAQIDENSSGSYAEVVHEIAEARGTYTTLHDAIAAIESGKEDKSNKAARITSSNIGSGTNYPTVAAVAQYLGANYYNKNDIDDSTYTKSEADTALAAKAEKSTVDSITENPDFFVLNSQTLGGVTVTDNGDGTYTFDSNNAVTDATVLFPSFVLPAGAYEAKIETVSGSSEAYSGGGAAQIAIRYGTGDGTTWLNPNSQNSAVKTFATDTIVFLRLNRGTYNSLSLKISITENGYITAVDEVARKASGFSEEQLKILSGKISAQTGAFYPIEEPDDFTWKDSPLHGKILTDFHGNYQVDFDVASCKNPIGKAYYVAPNGSDSNDGTPGAPLANMSTAYNAGADTIYLYPGIYDRTQTLYTPTTGSNSKPITRNVNIIGLGSGAILSTKVVNIVNISEYPTEGTGVWECYANNTTYLTNVVDIKNKTADGHFTKYTQLSSVSAVQAAAGSWALVNGKAYIHTIDGNKPVNGDNVLFLHSTAPSSSVQYPLFYVTGGKVYFENLTCMEGTTPLFVQRQANGSDIEIYAKNCNFFYSRTEDHDVVMLQGTTLSIFQNCEASFGMKDGFNYHVRQNVIPKAVEINCIGVGNGNISDGNDQGSTIHDGGSIIRVRDVCAHNYGANYSDQGVGTESWNVGCVGFESWCNTTTGNQNADFFALPNTKMFLDGCVSFGSKHNFNYASPDENSEDEAGAIYLRCMVENVANKVTSITSASTDEQYPSAKAVYAATQAALSLAKNYTDSIGDEIKGSKKLVIPDGTTVVTAAMVPDRDIEYVELPGGVARIDDEAFMNCRRLKFIHRGEKKLGDPSYIEIGESAFCNCVSLAAFLEDNGTNEIEINFKNVETTAFKNCISLISCFGLHGDIGDSAFANCRSLSFCRIESVNSIGNIAFKNCVNLNSVVLMNRYGVEIGSGGVEIGSGVFEGCYNLKNISLFEGYFESIGDYSFCECQSLEQIDLNKVGSIGALAFIYTGLKYLVLPDSVDSIDGQTGLNGNGLISHSINLVDIVILGTPTMTINNMWPNVNSGLRIFVPESNFSFFTSDPVWSIFYQMGLIVKIEDHLDYLLHTKGIDLYRWGYSDQ